MSLMFSVGLVLPFLLTPPALASDNNFCGTSWSAASTSCEERRHCPTGSDDECTAPEICYADTLCDASKGHGAKAAVAGLAYLLDIAYEDVKNRKFCGSWWASAQESCGLDTFCGVEPDGCQDFMSCYETQCHIQDLVAQEMGSDWKELLTSSNGGDEDGKAVKLDEKDVRRSNYCGTTWADATSKCGTWCLGEDTDCPGNLKCFAETTCYYDEDLVPTLSPTVSPPTTESPISSDDPRNNQFCGETWGKAIEKCKPETNCGKDDDCPEGESCHGYLPGCDLLKMVDDTKEAESDAQGLLWFRKNDVTNTFFCGESYLEAVEECSIETHCPDNKCPEGKTCFQYIEQNGCDVYQIWMNLTPEPTPVPTIITESPTSVVTDEPVKQPTTKPPTTAPVPLKYGLCAKDLEHLQQTYRTASECSNVEPCPDKDLTCLFDIDFESVSEKKPTKEPSKRPSKKPSKKPTPPTRAPRKEFFTLAPMSPAISQLETILPQITTGSDPENSEILVGSDDQTQTVVRPPYMIDTEFPTYSDTFEMKDLKFYCAASINELKISCDSALECTNGATVCPDGQGCIHYDCEKNDSSTTDDDDTSDVNDSANDDRGTDFSNFIPDCPLDFVGFTSRSEVNCKLYYECKDGEIGEALLCDKGLKYDTIRNMCWYEDEVDLNCRGPPVDTFEPTDLPSHRPTYDTSNLFCPESLVGATSSGDTNCKMYYYCNNGEVGDVNTCRDDFKYDIVRQMCWYKEDVNQHCYGPPIGQSVHESTGNSDQSQNNEAGDRKESNTTLTSYDCLDGYTGWAVRHGCKDYYWCTNGTMERDILHCVENLLFDVLHGTCKHAHEVHCNRTLQNSKKEPSAEVDSTRYAWPESDTTSAVSENPSPDVGEWAYSRTQVYINNLGYSSKPITLCLFFLPLIINTIQLSY